MAELSESSDPTFARRECRSGAFSSLRLSWWPLYMPPKLRRTSIRAARITVEINEARSTYPPEPQFPMGSVLAATWSGLRTLTWKTGANSRISRITVQVRQIRGSVSARPTTELNQAQAGPGSVTRDCMGSEPISDCQGATLGEYVLNVIRVCRFAPAQPAPAPSQLHPFRSEWEAAGTRQRPPR